jgi:hypothetical protein
MRALKFLRPGRRGPFSGVKWPAPGDWLDADDGLELCRAGIHAILPEVLAVWIAEELWQVELDDVTGPVRGVVVARRGVLLSPVSTWNDDAAREFARACVDHVRERASGRAAEYIADAIAKAENVAADSSANAVGYVTARAAEAITPGRFMTERRWQSTWLANRLCIGTP